MKPILKWPGGKSREIAQIYGMIPSYDRYIEPFFGGGALYFHLQPEKAAINDTAKDLMAFYRLVKAQDPELQACLWAYEGSFRGILELCRLRMTAILDLFAQVCQDRAAGTEALSRLLDSWMPEILRLFARPLIHDETAFRRELERSVLDKLLRTAKNHQKRPFTPDDLAENLVTGFASGYYMYFRRICNDWSLGRLDLCEAEKAANFFFIREYCYGSMFRYNAKGEFNIPYGGMSYNDKDFAGKIHAMFNGDTAALFAGTELCSMDFEAFLENVQPTENDFIFLDPPYDTEFSDYEGNAFTKLDHARLAVTLSRTKAKFLLIIKDTPYISALYGQGFYITSFDKQYTYNVRSRNDRSAQHLVVTNYKPLDA